MDNKEWLDEYPSLKQVNQNNPFTVPEGYFDELHQRAMSRAFIDGVNAAGDGFVTPESYFNELESNLQSRINVEAALENNTTGFTVPDNYFNNMQASLQSRINIEEALQHTNGDFTVPENYFDDLQQQITSRIAVEEALDAGHDGFTVPDQYFDKLQSAILNKTTQPAAKRNAVIRKMFTSGVFKYATAACLVLAVGGTLFLKQFESPQAVHQRSYIHKALANVPDADIIDYLQTHMDAADTRSLMDGADLINTDNADAEDLKQYLSTH